MKKLAALSLIASLGFVPPALSQTVLSDFSDIAGDGAVFLDTWSDGVTAQYTQNAGTISIEPVGPGNPQGDGWFLVTRSLNLNNFASVEVTGQEGGGNLVNVFSVLFFNSDGIGGQGPEQVFTFNASDFAGSLTTRSISLSSPTFTHPSFDPTAVEYWAIEGNYAQSGVDFRFEFDNLALTPVPEPGTIALLAAGGGLLMWRRFRRKG
ncbi:MAG TPA: hypothetical protein DCY13_20455 [Verrucomicrobiales bacterium]|nr:hypothetical protein [Verrucomicrobiales bacterium]